MAWVDCIYCGGSGVSHYARFYDGAPLPCEWCGGNGKMGAITAEEIRTRRFDIVNRVKFERNVVEVEEDEEYDYEEE